MSHSSRAASFRGSRADLGRPALLSFATLLAGRLARIALVAPALQRLKRNAVRTAIGIGLVAVLGGLGLTYLLIALRYQLEREIGPLWTPVAIGGVLALAALVAYAALLRPRRARRAVASEPVGLPPELAAPLRNIESTVPKAKTAKAEDLIDDSVLRRLDQSGFIDNLYR